jgi:hypothetical protein
MTDVKTDPAQPWAGIEPRTPPAADPLTADEEARYGRRQIDLIWLRFVRNRASVGRS